MIERTEEGFTINWSDKSFFAPLIRHTSTADNLAFDKLWNERQEIAEIVRRAIREGRRDNGRGYKKIREILERVS